jgi:hypothetical protein
MPGRRVRILCEDRLTERFLRRLCERFGVHVLESSVAPSGRGAASVWVKKQYPASVRALRARRHQQNLGLLIGIDGDNQGVQARERELAEELVAAQEPPREPAEPIALFVPTWSIETWLAYLCVRGDPTEDRSLKSDAACRDLWEDGKRASATIAQAVKAWRTEVVPLPSLAAAYQESNRLSLD